MRVDSQEGLGIFCRTKTSRDLWEVNFGDWGNKCHRFQLWPRGTNNVKKIESVANLVHLFCLGASLVKRFHCLLLFRNTLFSLHVQCQALGYVVFRADTVNAFLGFAKSSVDSLRRIARGSQQFVVQEHHLHE